MLIFGLSFGPKIAAKIFNVKEHQIRSLLSSVNPAEYKIVLFLQQCLLSASNMLEKQHLCQTIGLSSENYHFLLYHLTKTTICHDLSEINLSEINANSAFVRRRVVCEVCGQKCQDKSKLKRHMLSHTGEKPFACKECGKTFSLNYNLKAHLKKHTNDEFKA